MNSETQSKGRELSSGMLRQRRNLLAISIAMPLFYASGAVVERISILGTVLKLTNPKVISYGVVVLFVYFLWRYWQYHRVEKHHKEMAKSFWNHVYCLEKTYFYKQATIGLESVLSDFVEVSFFTDNARNNKTSENAKISLFSTRLDYRLSTPSGIGSQRIDQFHEYMSDNETERVTIDQPSLSAFEKVKYKGTLRYSPFLVIFYRFIGAIKYMAVESYFTDYQLPFVFSFLGASISAWIYLM